MITEHFVTHLILVIITIQMGILPAIVLLQGG